MEECQFLHRLPTELRLRVYEYVLRFDKPLKLRQHVAGSPNSSILRANRQVHSEALPIFYDVNTIMASRNDFCKDTDPDLQTPLRRDQVRHLLIRNFSQSIRCSSFSGGNNMFLAGCCDVCKPNANGFITALANLPRIQSVVVDYHNHCREFGFIKETIRGIGSTSVDAPCGFSITCTDMARYRLTSPAIPSELSITFVDAPFNAIWNECLARTEDFSVYGIPDEDAFLQRLRDEVDRELPEKLYWFHCAKHYKLWGTDCFEEPARLWNDLEDARTGGGDAGKELEAFTDHLKHFCDRASDMNMKSLMIIMRSHARQDLA